MSIILRTLKGSALTYEEMDRNLSQYFYSSSVHDSGTELRLHYTGSDNLDTPSEDYGPTRYQSVTIGSGGSGGVTKIIAGTGVSISPVSGVGNVTISSTGGAGSTPGGSNGSIQFNNSSTFDGDSKLFYNSSSYLVGIGTNTQSSRLHIVGDSKASATLRLEAALTGASQYAQTLIYSGTTKIGGYGKVYSGETASYISTYNNNKLHFEYNSKKIATITGAGLGIGRETPNRALTVNGSIGISNDASSNLNQSIIQPIVNGVYISNALGSDPESYGLMLSGPLTGQNNAGGHVVVSLSENTGGSKTAGKSKNSFTIISSENENYTNASSVATFRSDGKVGINLEVDTDPETALHVNGQIRGGAKLDYTDPETTVDLASYRVVKKLVQQNQTLLAPNTSALTGTEATVIIVGVGGAQKTLSFGGNFKTVGSLFVGGTNSYTLKFVSDGTNWYETSRTSALS